MPGIKFIYAAIALHIGLHGALGRQRRSAMSAC